MAGLQLIMHLFLNTIIMYTHLHSFFPPYIKAYIYFLQLRELWFTAYLTQQKTVTVSSLAPKTSAEKTTARSTGTGRDKRNPSSMSTDSFGLPALMCLIIIERI